jgi:dipeptidyl aminopeptidase/acylaminoacyl peptidase
MLYARIAFAALLCIAMPAAARAQAPTIDQLIELKRAGSPAISPNGQWVAYTVRETHWDDNNYHTEIWLADAKTGELRQLTNHVKKSSTSPQWSPDSTKLAFATDRDEKRQIYVIDPRGGEAQKLTAAEDGVGPFQWAPDGKSIAFATPDPKSDADKDREKKLGEFDVYGEGYRMSHLWVWDIAAKKARRLTSGAFTVGSFNWSPDSNQIAFDHRVNTANTSGATADISVVNVADGAVRKLVEQEGADSGPVWSPDGSKIAFGSAMKKEFSFLNNGIGVIASAGGAIEYLTTAFDENPGIVDWNRGGLFFSAAQRTSVYLFSVDPATKAIKKYIPSDRFIGSGFSMTPDGQTVAYVASDASTLGEVYVSALAPLGAEARSAKAARKLTDMTAQTSSWTKHAIELISWKSQDGASIEGVLHKPAGFQAGKKYPLLVVIHGGPTGTSRPQAFASTSTYPIDVWTSKGALVLEPNYRGSAGYGEAFRSLNVRNLGVGDAWDVLSGIDHLIKEGLADPDRIGTMGWSQGGYISAYLATHDSARFKAVSVGAGISNWMTYYVNTDITQFTRHYLKATPWDDPEIYAKTSPMTYIKSARAPTLIQHGATDQRVPPPNAYELYRGLQDVGVPSKLIVYKGFEGIGHGPSKPKSSRAVMQHNLEWFDKYIFNVGSTATSQQGK